MDENEINRQYLRLSDVYLNDTFIIFWLFCWELRTVMMIGAWPIILSCNVIRANRCCSRRHLQFVWSTKWIERPCEYGPLYNNFCFFFASIGSVYFMSFFEGQERSLYISSSRRSTPDLERLEQDFGIQTNRMMVPSSTTVLRVPTWLILLFILMYLKEKTLKIYSRNPKILM